MLYFFLIERKYWEVLEVRRGLWSKGPIYHSLPVPETKCYVGEFEFLRESIFSLYLGECLLNALLTRMGRLPVERMMSDLKVDILPQRARRLSYTWLALHCRVLSGSHVKNRTDGKAVDSLHGFQAPMWTPVIHVQPFPKLIIFLKY